MREQDYGLVCCVQALNEVDLVRIGQRAIHKQIALVVISGVEADDDPLLTLKGEVARILLQTELRCFQSLAEKTLRAAVHLVIRIEHERAFRSTGRGVYKVGELLIGIEKAC